MVIEDDHQHELTVPTPAHDDPAHGEDSASGPDTCGLDPHAPGEGVCAAEPQPRLPPSTEVCRPGEEEAAAATCDPEYATFEGRAKAVQQHFATTAPANVSFEKAECFFWLGRREEAMKCVDRGLESLTPGNKINRWMHGGNTGFVSWPGIECYLRFQHLLDPETKERYRKIYTGGVFYARLSTSNHKTMAALARYLATQVWGAESFKADPWFMANDAYIQEQSYRCREKYHLGPDFVWGVDFTGGDETGEKFLYQLVGDVLKVGPPEYASRPYGAQNVLPLLALADCATDEVLRSKALFAYEACLAYVAPCWLRGALATFSPRSYPDTECQQPWGFAALLWLYFGGVPPAMRSAQGAAPAAVSRYRVPEAILNAANDRSSAYFHRSMMGWWALNHYVNKEYALFSRSPKVGGRPFGGQSLPCGVMWEEPDVHRGNHLWVTHPAADEPGKMGLHTHGIQQWEQDVLGRDCLLFVFDIKPEATAFPYALCYIPGGHRAHINNAASEGKIFLHYGTVLIAVTSTEPFDWDPDGGILAPASKPREGDSEFRVRSLACAVSVETASPAEFLGAGPEQQLSAFDKEVSKASALEMVGKQPSAARYRTRRGDEVLCTFNGVDAVNGKELDYKSWPVAESPWTRQETAAGPLEVTFGPTVRKYDFTTWSISEEERVGGRAYE